AGHHLAPGRVLRQPAKLVRGVVCTDRRSRPGTVSLGSLYALAQVFSMSVPYPATTSKRLALLPPVLRTVSMNSWLTRVSVAYALPTEPALLKSDSSLSASNSSFSFLPAKKVAICSQYERNFCSASGLNVWNVVGNFSFAPESIQPPSQWMLMTQNMPAWMIQSTTWFTRRSLSPWMRPPTA